MASWCPCLRSAIGKRPVAPAACLLLSASEAANGRAGPVSIRSGRRQVEQTPGPSPQPRTIILGAGRAILEQMAGIDAGGQQCVALQVSGLSIGVGGNAHVADKHVRTR